jgi:hypothetical protein
LAHITENDTLKEVSALKIEEGLYAKFDPRDANEKAGDSGVMVDPACVAVMRARQSVLLAAMSEMKHVRDWRRE